MITREEALSDKPFIQAECEKCDYVDLYYNDSAYKRMINQIYDGFEQHIKSLEAQLANTEQLTCETCKWRNCLASEMEPCNSCLIKLGYGNNYQPKDTK